MRRELTLLLTSSGRRVELLRCFVADAENLGIRLRTVATDMAPHLSAACAVADRSISAPRCTDPGYPLFLMDLCARERVDLLVPTIDLELATLASMREKLVKTGVHTAVSSPDVVALARDKLRTARDLLAAGIETPRTMAFEVSRGLSGLPYPFILKPRSGSSSKGVQVVRGPNDLTLAHEAGEWIVQEFLDGQEYTVNMYFDTHGVLKCAVPHRRIETRAGEVSKAETVRLPILEEMGWKLGEFLNGARGSLCFQAIVSSDDGTPSLFEINARFGGGYPIAHRAGAPFTRWLLEEVAGLAPTTNNAWRGGVRMLRFDAAVFI
jgi:carbamoyl-phosphate synthase large subunit